MTRPWRSDVVVSSISWMTAGSVSAVALDRAGERVAAERAEPDAAQLGLLAVAQRHAVVVDHDQRAVALDDRPRRAEVQRHDRDLLAGGCTATRRARSSSTAGTPAASRRGCGGRCRCATARAAAASGPSGAAPSGSRRSAPWPATSPRRGGRRRTPGRTRTCRAPASAPRSSTCRCAPPSRG